MIKIHKDLLNKLNLNKKDIIVVGPKSGEYDFGVVNIKTAEVYGGMNKKKELVKQKFKCYETNIEPSFFQMFVDKILDFEIIEDVAETSEKTKKENNNKENNNKEEIKQIANQPETDLKIDNSSTNKRKIPTPEEIRKKLGQQPSLF